MHKADLAHVMAVQTETAGAAIADNQRELRGRGVVPHSRLTSARLRRDPRPGGELRRIIGALTTSIAISGVVCAQGWRGSSGWPNSSQAPRRSPLSYAA